MVLENGLGCSCGTADQHIVRVYGVGGKSHISIGTTCVEHIDVHSLGGDVGDLGHRACIVGCGRERPGAVRLHREVANVCNGDGRACAAGRIGLPCDGEGLHAERSAIAGNIVGDHIARGRDVFIGR